MIIPYIYVNMELQEVTVHFHLLSSGAYYPEKYIEKSSLNEPYEHNTFQRERDVRQIMTSTVDPRTKRITFLYWP